MKCKIALSTLLTIAIAQSGFAQGQPTEDQPAPAPADPSESLQEPPVAESEEGPPAPEGVPAEPPPLPAEEPVASAEAEPTLTVAYNKNLSIARSDDQYALDLSVRGQLRAEVFREEETDEFESHFLIPRMRLQLEGHAYGPANRYKVEFELSGSGNPRLADYFVEHEFSPALRVRAGQWKRPFNRQELVSDFGSGLIERSITNGFAGGGRDLGIALHNGYEKSPEGIEWALGVFNGTGERARQTLSCTDPMDVTTCTPTTPSNVPGDFGPIVVVRVGWNQGGIKGYSDGDLEGGPLRFAVAVSYKADLRDLAEDEAGDLQIQHAAEADFIIKAHGADVSGAGFLVKSGSADALLGFYGQAGYFVLPKSLQVAARFSMHQLATDNNRLEALGGLNWYFQGHSYKWMTDAGILQTTGDASVTDFQARTQLQFVF